LGLKLSEGARLGAMLEKMQLIKGRAAMFIERRASTLWKRAASAANRGAAPAQCIG
jgi:hypothetical protein